MKKILDQQLNVNASELRSLPLIVITEDVFRLSNNENEAQSDCRDCDCIDCD